MNLVHMYKIILAHKCLHKRKILFYLEHEYFKLYLCCICIVFVMKYGATSEMSDSTVTQWGEKCRRICNICHKHYFLLYLCCICIPVCIRIFVWICICICICIVIVRLDREKSAAVSGACVTRTVSARPTCSFSRPRTIHHPKKTSRLTRTSAKNIYQTTKVFPK